MVESIHEGMEALVLQQSLGQKLAGRLGVIDEQGEEPLFLLAEVPDRLLREEAKKALAGRAPGRRVGIGASTRAWWWSCESGIRDG